MIYENAFIDKQDIHLLMLMSDITTYENKIILVILNHFC